MASLAMCAHLKSKKGEIALERRNGSSVLIERRWRQRSESIARVLSPKSIGDANKFALTFVRIFDQLLCYRPIGVCTEWPLLGPTIRAFGIDTTNVHFQGR
jgi:hypothetical protein